MIVRALKKESFPFCGVIVSHADMTQQPTQGANAPPGRVPSCSTLQEKCDEKSETDLFSGHCVVHPGV